MGSPKARIEELVPVVDPQPSRVGDVWRATFLSVRGSWCLESRASEGRFLPLHVRPDTASKCESFPGRDEVSRKPCSRGVIAGARSPRPNRMRSHACSDELGPGWDENPHDVVVEIANQCPN